jgi:hypothetical protein
MLFLYGLKTSIIITRLISSYVFTAKKPLFYRINMCDRCSFDTRLLEAHRSSAMSRSTGWQLLPSSGSSNNSDRNKNHQKVPETIGNHWIYPVEENKMRLQDFGNAIAFTRLLTAGEDSRTTVYSILVPDICWVSLTLHPTYNYNYFVT